MFPTKCQVQNDRIDRAVISCFCQNLQFRLYFVIKTSIFKLRPLLRFLCLINSFQRRYVSSMYNRSNRFNRSNRSNRFNRSNTFMGPGRSIRNVTWERNPPVTRSNKFPGYQVRKSQVSPRLLTSGQYFLLILYDI